MTALSSKLDAVTVYREGAICRRIATIPAGTERVVRVGHLPLSLDAGSFRARVVGSSGRVLDVRAQFDIEFAEETDIPAEQRAVEHSSAKVLRLEQLRARVHNEIVELQALKPSFLEPKRGEPPRPAPVDAMLALGAFSEEELKTRLARRRELDQELKDAREELQLHQRRLTEAGSAKRTERSKVWRAAVITLAEPPSAPVQLELEYRVPGARWVPSYSLTLERGLHNGTLQMRASIAQNTGEDWAQVKVGLSTASISRRADMPELKALKIGRRQEAPQRSGWREPPPGLEGLFEAYDVSVGPPTTPPPVHGFGAAATGRLDQGEAAGGLLRQEKERAKAAPPPPPPPPRMMAAPVASYAMPSAPPMGAAMPKPQPAARKSAGLMGNLSPGGGGVRSRELAREEVAEPAPDEEGYASFDEDVITGTGPVGETDDGVTGLDAQFNDYARLTMKGPGAPPSQRGRLGGAPEWDFAFVAGLSVQVDVVVAVVSRSYRSAMGVQSLALPALCNPVNSVKSFDYAYECGARLDVPSTGTWVLVPVMQCAVGLTPEYVCVPSVEQKVYRTLTIANRSTHALLPGPVDVTSGDEFLMTTSLPAITPGADQSHRLGLGVEESLKVSRKTQYKETTGGFLGGSTVLPHEVEIELNNRLATPALIEVRERVPVVDASEKDLKVEEAQITPPWDKVETPIDDQVLKGARRWRVTVPPGQSMKLTAQYAIRMPNDRMLVGGNRRN